jgi:hypothetical protein
VAAATDLPAYAAQWWMMMLIGAGPIAEGDRNAGNYNMQAENESRK